MKTKHITLIMAVVSICLLAAALIHASDKHLLTSHTPLQIEYSYMAGDSVSIQMDAFELKAPVNSLIHDMTISLTLIPHRQGIAMPSRMTNVTADVDAYRLLPHGEHFSAPAQMTITYHPALIPTGYHPDDVYTYYYDEEIAEWKQLKRIAVDTIAHTITSLTTHFTDFANAVIKVPEMPETKAFVPTAISGLPDVDPLQGIPMIAAPQANNRATAELTYPIQIPQGRGGLQPNVDLHYSSAAGNGVLGVGWSMPTPAITIDTRWGVPRFDIDKETEVYLLNGEQLVLHDANGRACPLPHQAKDLGFVKRTYGRTEFYARNTKNQDRIVRYGNNLDSYWWVVTSRDGTKYIYGHDPLGNSDQYTRVFDAAGYISYWALTEVIDLYGNYTHYSYEKDGNELYLSRIDYTGNLSEYAPATYSIRFQYEQREDIVSNGRLGVLQKRQKRLRCITTFFQDTPIAQYRLRYSYGSNTLFKSRLESITKYDRPTCATCMDYDDTDIQPTYENWNSLDCYIEVWNQSSRLNIGQYLEQEQEEVVPGSTTEFTYEDAVPLTEIFSIAHPVDFPKNYNKSQNDSWSIGGTATFGFGQLPIKTDMSVGGHYTYNRSTGQQLSMLMDIDGDGLVDIVGKDRNNSVFYHKQLTNGSFAAEQVVRGVNSLSREISSSHNFGIQADAFVNISYSPTIDNSYTDTYFTDVNNDGLPDMITPDGILVNHLENGIPRFEAYDESSALIAINDSSCGMVYRGGSVDERLECKNTWVLDTIVQRKDYLRVSYSGPQDQLFEDSLNAKSIPHFEDDEFSDREEYLRHNDWYKEWQRQNPSSDKEEKDYTQVPPLLGDTAQYATSYNFPPQWESSDYKIVSNGNLLYIYHLETQCTVVSDLPDVDIVKVWVAPHEGIISLESVIQLQEDHSRSRRESRRVDGVKYYIQVNQNLLDSGTIAPDNYEAVTLTHSALSVQANDVLIFRLSANSDRRFDNSDWVHTITYETGESYNSAADYVCSGNNDFYAPTSGHYRTGYTIETASGANVEVHIKKNGCCIENSSLEQWLTITEGDKIEFEATYTGATEPQWSNVHIFPYVDFVASSMPDSLRWDTLHYTPDIHIECSSILPKTSTYRSIFGLLHKGWGQFAYNNREHDEIIDITELHNEDQQRAYQLRSDSANFTSQFTNIDTTGITEQNGIEELPENIQVLLDSIKTYDPLNDNGKWIAMYADCASETWQAYGRLGSIGARLHSTSIALAKDTMNEDVEDVEYDSSIPIRSDANPATTVRKHSFSVQHTISASASFGFGGLNKNFAYGSNNVRMDYMDMNGDGFPDFVGESSIQYSTPWGGIGDAAEPSGIQPVHNQTFSNGSGYSRGGNVWRRITTNNPKHFNVYNASLGGGAGTSQTWNHGHITYVDLNADGLPDIVDVKHDSVWYNLGYSFSEPEPIDLQFVINEGLSSSASLSGSNLFTHYYRTLVDFQEKLRGLQNIEEISRAIKDFSICQYSISGGISASGAVNATLAQMIDINGDGHLDRLALDGIHQKVRLGHNGLLDTDDTTVFSRPIVSYTSNIGINAGLTLGFTWPIFNLKFCFGVQSTPWARSTTYGNSGFTDINGDGFVDFIYNYTDDFESMMVCYNQNGERPVNLLKTITNPTGQVITITYEQNIPSTERRGRTWQMEKVQDEITAQDDTQRKELKIEYESPHYDYFEKEDFGYAYVRSTSDNDKSLMEWYHNKDFISRGEKWRDLLMGEGRKYIGHSQELRYSYPYGRIEEGLCDDASIFIEEEGYWTDYYEGEDSARITTRYNVIYDQWHNMIGWHDRGDIAITGDEWEQTIKYHEPQTQRWHYNLISLPRQKMVSTATDSEIRLTDCYYNSFGRPEWIVRHNLQASEEAATYMEYDHYGNVSQVSLPEYDLTTRKRPWRQYKYDAVTHSYPIVITSQFGERQYASYDYTWGLPTLMIDPAGNGIVYEYDYLGRLSTITAPKEYTSTAPFSVCYRYYLANHDIWSDSDRASSYVLKLTLSEGLPTAATTIYDQRGMAIQHKSLFEVGETRCWVADGVRKLDAYYRPIAIYAPFVANDEAGVYEDNIRQNPTTYMYDAMDRAISVENPDGSRHRSEYTFETDQNGYLRMATTITDENDVLTRRLASPQEWVIETITGDSSITQYEYNPIGELLHVTDADQYETTYKYDMLGNCISRTHPDAGTTLWQYAPAGNVIATQSSVQKEHDIWTTYDYDYTRLEGISYPLYPENNVSYTYDFAGRISSIEDGAGFCQLTYDALGNVERSIRQIVIPTEEYKYTFQTEYSYDSFGRMRSMVYPDSEIVNYGYTAGGMLNNVIGKKGSTTHVYLSNRTYDKYGRKVRQEYGNGVVNEYSYDPQRQWMNGLKTITTNYNDSLLNLKYEYDPVGNIIKIDQAASSQLTGLNSPYANTYEYDTQYRLIKAFGGYGMDFKASYSSSGKIGHKHTHCSYWDIDLQIGYDNQHLTHQPRGVETSNVGAMSLFWDANGNLNQIETCNRGRRFHEWDDENRLRFVVGEQYAGYYGYDGNGERVYKLTGTSSISQLNSGKQEVSIYFDDLAVYPNPYMVVTPRGYTKHYYAESERLATVTGMGGFGDIIAPINKEDDYVHHDSIIFDSFYSRYEEQYPFGYLDTTEMIHPLVDIDWRPTLKLDYYTCAPASLSYVGIAADNDMLYHPVYDYIDSLGIETEIYFYHGDHLGSASWITNQTGKPIQYLHYAPYGELIVNETLDGYDERYKFTGKERDEESGYDYYGARFYWHLLGIWLSVDPMVDKYLWINPYAFCAWNPVKYLDPNGKWFETAWDVANVLMDAGSLVSNIRERNVGGAIADGAALILDAGATILPMVPGGAGTLIKTYRTADKAVDVIQAGKKIDKTADFQKNMARGIQNEKKVLNDMGLTKNTQKIASETKAKRPINVIPDAVQDGVIYEIKDTKTLSNTKQIQGEYNAAKEAGFEFKIITGEKTHVSSTIPSNVEVIRRSDLGPQ